MIFRYFLILSIFLVGIACKTEPSEVQVESFYETQLFKDAQLAAVYKDSKTLVDLVPRAPYPILEERYLALKDQPEFDLRTFVENNFQDYSMDSLEFVTDTTKTMHEHINNMWDNLTRGPDKMLKNSSRIPLPKKYIVPGGRFQEIYYWDSYFTMEGLLAAERVDLAENMVDNFTFLIDSLGFIPNGTRDYYNTRSQPPFYGMMVRALARENRDLIVYYLPELGKEYDFFMKHDSINKSYEASMHVVKMPNDGFLNRYYDSANTPRPEAYKEDLHLANGLKVLEEKEQLYKNLRSAAESGWDFSSRWYATPDDFSSTNTTAILPVDLNCLLYNLEQLLAMGSKMKGDVAAADYYSKKAEQRSTLINTYMWNEEFGYYMDYNFKRKAQTNELTLAGIYPLFFRMASDKQAEKVKEMIMSKFLKEGGLVTTLNYSGQQWDAPNGWAPLQWIAVKGLLAYGYTDEAKEIMERWLALNEKVYANTGKMMEKYNVEDLSLLSGGGEYETQDGFGWTNGVALGFEQLLAIMDEDKH